ncbi:MAG: pilus assembly protein PilM [Chromatiaceae bacterium]|jgi:type IV pilus assembly protein PilM|nr:pilus assembly protein PilM [Chromatiaceae bacterium]
MFTFGRKKPALVGLDISSTAIKLIELSQTAGTTASAFRVENYAVEPLPPNAVVEKKIANIQAVGETIRKAVASSGTKAKVAAAAVSGSAVITKVISMSATLSDAEMEAQIQLEADQYIPYPLEEVNIDFDVLGPSDSGGNMVDVLLAASRQENVDDRVAASEIGGLTATIIDVEAYAVESAYALLMDARNEEGEERTVAIADIGATATTLHVLHNGQTVYTREQNFGGLQLIEEVQRRYGMARDDALRQVIAGGLPDNYTTEILGPFKEALAQQIGRALQFFYSASTFNHVDRIVLAGGVASVRGIDELVEERLGTATVVANPFTHMSLSSKLRSSALNKVAPALIIAVGLALRGFD